MSVTIGDQQYPEEQAAIVAAPRGVSLHPLGTWEAPCHHCGVVCLLSLKNHLWRERAGTLVFCGPCAIQHHSDMAVGCVGDRVVTLREAIDEGFVKIPP